MGTQHFFTGLLSDWARPAQVLAAASILEACITRIRQVASGEHYVAAFATDETIDIGLLVPWTRGVLSPSVSRRLGVAAALRLLCEHGLAPERTPDEHAATQRAVSFLALALLAYDTRMRRLLLAEHDHHAAMGTRGPMPRIDAMRLLDERVGILAELRQTLGHLTGGGVDSDDDDDDADEAVARATGALLNRVHRILVFKHDMPWWPAAPEASSVPVSPRSPSQ